MRKWCLLGLWGIFLPVIALGEESDQGNALTVFNAFIARYAPVEIEWRTEIHLLAAADGAIPPGFEVGHSGMGDFSYRAKTFGELDMDGKRALIRDPRLPAFIESLRNAQPEVATTDKPKTEAKLKALSSDEPARLAVEDLLAELPAGHRRPEDVIQIIEITADQILRDQPVRIFVPSTE